MLRLLVSLLILAASGLIGFGGSARADNIEDRARAHLEAGRWFYEPERYREALHEFAAGYTLGPQRLFLISSGQSHRHMDVNERALAMFRRFIEVAPAAEEMSP